jgi:hypothetical protein
MSPWKPFSCALLLALLFTGSALAQSEFGKAQYLKAAAAGQKNGDRIDGSLVFESAEKELKFKDKNGADAFAIKYGAIKSMLYEKTAKPRYAAGLLIAWPLLFTKSKSHYLTVHYTDSAGGGQYVIVKLHKDNFRDTIAKAEAETGKKVERSEEH